MTPKTFSKKEAISRGIDMTKKYFAVILTAGLIYIAFQAIFQLLPKWAGSSFIPKANIQALYPQQPEMSAKLNQYLQDSGYINAYGLVQGKLEDLFAPSLLDLPSVFENDRGKIYNFLQNYRYRLPFPKPIYYLLLVVLWGAAMLMGLGWKKMALMASRDQEPGLNELFTNTPIFIPYFLASLCYGLAILGGFILLIVPGIIFAIAMEMYPYFIIDCKTRGPGEALRSSLKITKGVRWQLFFFGLLIFLFNLAGCLCLLVGLIFTIPASSIATAYVYDQLRKQTELPGPVAA